MNEQEARPASTYVEGEQVSPTLGSFKGKVGTVLEVAWGDTSKEWMYRVKFTKGKHIYYDNELRKVSNE